MIFFTLLKQDFHSINVSTRFTLSITLRTKYRCAYYLQWIRQKLLTKKRWQTSSVIRQKGESQNGCFKKSKARQNFRKANISVLDALRDQYWLCPYFTKVLSIKECVKIPMPAHQVLSLTGYNFGASFSTSATLVNKI